MADDVIRISLERHVWIVPNHPLVKGVMQEEIGQQRAHDAPLRRTLFSPYPRPVRHGHVRLEPTLDIEGYPGPVAMLAHGFHHELMIDVIEEARDVQVKYPVVAPAPIASSPQGLMRRAARPIPIRVCMEARLQQGLEPSLNYHLCHTICHGRDT